MAFCAICLTRSICLPMQTFVRRWWRRGLKLSYFDPKPIYYYGGRSLFQEFVAKESSSLSSSSLHEPYEPTSLADETTSCQENNKWFAEDPRQQVTSDK